MTKIKHKLILGFLLPVLLMVLLGVVCYSQSSIALKENYEASIMRTMMSKGEYLGLAMTTIENDVIKLLTDPNFISYYTGEAKSNVEAEELYKSVYKNCAKVATSNDFVYSFNVISGYGKNYATKGTLGSNAYEAFLSSEEGKALDKSQKRYDWKGYHTFIDETTHNTSTEYAMSLTNQFIQGEGFVIIDLNRKQVIESLAELDFGSGSSVGLIAPDGRETLVGTEELGGFSDMKVFSDSLLDEKAMGYEYIRKSGKSYLFAYSKIGNTGAMLCALIPRNIIISDAEAIKKVTILSVVLAGLIAIMIGTFIARGIEKAIGKMQQALYYASEGDLTTHVEVKRKDEFWQLAKSMMTMFSNMKELIYKTTGVGDEIIQSSKEMAHISNTLLESSQEINEAISEIQRGATIQAEDASHCLKQMDDLASKIEGLYKNTGAIETFTKETSAVAEKGVVLVDELKRKAKETMNATNGVIEDVEALENASITIEKMVSMINSIAEQTNLLALNASIEAARAGGAGKGFAVIAQEVSKLAEQSVRGAKEIEEVITNIQEQTRGTVIAVKKTKEIAVSQESALLVTVDVFQEIQEHIKQLAKNIGEISKDIQAIENAKEDTLSAVDNISAVAQQTAVASEEVQQTASKQLEAVEQLNEAARSLDQDAKKLAEAIGSFQI